MRAKLRSLKRRAMPYAKCFCPFRAWRKLLERSSQYILSGFESTGENAHDGIYQWVAVLEIAIHRVRDSTYCTFDLRGSAAKVKFWQVVFYGIFYNII